jgi:hypothetical protein
LTTPRVDALGVVFSALSTIDRNVANSLDPLDRVVANLLDEFLLGAMATFRVAAPRAVSTT